MKLALAVTGWQAAQVCRAGQRLRRSMDLFSPLLDSAPSDGASQTLLVSLWVCAAQRVMVVFFLSIFLMATTQPSSGERGYVTHLQGHTCGVKALGLAALPEMGIASPLGSYSA